ncbi:MAG: hypothetical protein ACRD27_00760 [Terracidiphilus sp.]
MADRMVGIGVIEAELDISKMIELSGSWKIWISGNDVTPIFDIVDYARQFLADRVHENDSDVSYRDVAEAVRKGYEKKRMEEAESLFLTPIGWSTSTFVASGHLLPDYERLKASIADHVLSVEIMITGFSKDVGYIFSLSGDGPQKGIVQRHDIPGFHAIGSGSYGALYMLYYREMSYRMEPREAAYYVMEAKLFGEQAGGVGEGTDMYVATNDGGFTKLNEDTTVEDRFVKVWYKLRPRWFGKESIELLNSIPEFKQFAKIKVRKRSRRTKKTGINSEGN